MTSPRPRPIFGPNPANTSVTGVPWAPGFAGSPTTTRVTSGGLQPGQGKRRYILTENGPIWLPENMQDMSAEEATQIAQTYDKAIQAQRTLLAQTTGLERRQIEAQIKDMEAGRANALTIARLQSADSRYGTDERTKVELAQLSQNQRQFDQTHALDLQRFGLDTRRLGLDTAKAYTDYAQTYDDIWALQDFKGALGRVGQGLGPQPISTSETQPHAKTWADFSALAGFDTLPAVQANQSGAMQAQQGGGMPGMPGSGSDSRVKAAGAIMKAIPPSDGTGHDEDNWAALNAIQNLYFAGKPGSVERLGRERQKIARGGLARRGFNPALVEEDYRRGLPGQRSARLA